MKQGIQLAVGALLAVLLFAWVLHDKDLGALRSTLASASIGGLVAASIVNHGHCVFRAWRWGVLLEPVRRGVRFRPMITAIFLGYLVSWAIPGRLGELVRAALLSEREEVPLGPCVGSVVADRVLDAVAIVILFAIGTALAPLAPEAATHTAAIRAAAVGLAATVVLGMGALVGLSAFRDRIEPWLAKRTGLVAWIGHAALGFAAGTDALRRPRLLPALLFHSGLMWVTIALGTWLGVRSAGAEIPFSGVLVMLPLLALGVAVPTPGGAGGYHAAMTFGLSQLFGVRGEVAAGAAILMHLVIVLPVFVLGPLLIRTEGLSWSDMLGAARQVKDLGAARRSETAA